MKKLKGGHKGYTIFKNTDKALVKAIKSVSLTDKEKAYTEFGGHGQCKIVQRLDNKDQVEYLVFAEKAKMHFVKHVDSEEEMHGDKLLYKINKEYPVGKYFREHFGLLDNGNSTIYGIQSMLNNNTNLGSNYDPTSVSLAGLMQDEFSYYKGEHKLYSNDITVPYYSYRSMMSHGSVSCYFDLDGNFVNRDYNFNMGKYKPVEKSSKEKVINKFLNMLKVYKNKKFRHYQNKWYTDDFVLILKVWNEDHELIKENKVEIYQIQKTSKKNYDYYDVYNKLGYKKPKRGLVDSSYEHFINTVSELINRQTFDEAFADLKLFANKKDVTE